MSAANRIILIAGMGTSPAVLTETVWALAHQEEPKDLLAAQKSLMNSSFAKARDDKRACNADSERRKG